MRIAIDFHNVLADLDARWREIAKQRYKLDIERKDNKQWKVWECTPITKEQFWTIIDWINNSHDNINLAPVQNGPFVANNLSENHEVTILTGAPEAAIPDIMYWARMHGMRSAKVVSVGNVKQTGKVKLQQPFDIFVDDNPYIVENVPEDKVAILFDCPWNHAAKVNNINTFRAFSWNDVLEIIEHIRK